MKIVIILFIMIIGIGVRYRWIEGSIKPLNILSTSAEGQALLHFNFPTFLAVKMKSGQYAQYRRMESERTNNPDIYWTTYKFNNYMPDPAIFTTNTVFYETLKDKIFKPAPVDDALAYCPSQLMLKFNMHDELMMHWRNIGEVN